MRHATLALGCLALAAGSSLAAAPTRPTSAAISKRTQPAPSLPPQLAPTRFSPASFSKSSDARKVHLDPASTGESIARVWNEEMLFAIRRDRARPTVHARNLYHFSAAVYDAWAAYDTVADQVLHHERATASDIESARRETISFAAYRLLRHRFQFSPGAATTNAELDATLASLGYDKTITTTTGTTPAALGNRIAATIIAFGLADGSNEDLDYLNFFYEPTNEPLIMSLPGNPWCTDPDRWQPLALDFFIDQNGNPAPDGYPPALSPEWGQVTPFALRLEDSVVYPRDGFDYRVYHDPGDFFRITTAPDDYKWHYTLVPIWQAHHDPADGVLIDISPRTVGNNPALPTSAADYRTFYDLFDGGDASQGHALNPVTGQPYAQQIVPRGDFARVLAEFWADGPSSETPPGHWFTIYNKVSDHPSFTTRLGGQGPALDPLEFDVKAYLALGGALHDAAVTAWGIKGAYDSIRPVSAIRYMSMLGQSADPNLPSYHPDGMPLVPGYIELITPESAAPGQRHHHLAAHVGKIALFTWRGPDFITVPATDVAGVGWILGEEWWPYQRPSFVSPPFPGYISGHSTYSRTAAEVMTLLTGSPYFPGGMGEFLAPQNQYLVFEDGPSVDITLQWATYQDASDQCSLSRIWGGIHPPMDDIPGRFIGQVVGPDAFTLATRYFDGRVACRAEFNADGALTPADVSAFITAFLEGSRAADVNLDRLLDSGDLAEYVTAYLSGCL